MTAVHDNEGNEIGKYDGRFVYDRLGEKLYWIDDGEVFSMPRVNREDELGARAAVKIAEISNRVAIDSQGETVFTL